MIFTICQTVAAVTAESEAMMGDSVAMFVDALTYLFNLVAERQKSRFDKNWKPPSTTLSRERLERIRTRAKRKRTLQLEIVPPLVSVLTLVVATGFILRSSIQLFVSDVSKKKSREEQGDPNIDLMMLFALLNLLLDFFNVFCFAKARRLCGYETTNMPGKQRRRRKHETSRRHHHHPQNYAQLQVTEDEEEDEEIMEGIDDMEGLSFSERMKAMKGDASHGGEENQEDVLAPQEESNGDAPRGGDDDIENVEKTEDPLQGNSLENGGDKGDPLVAGEPDGLQQLEDYDDDKMDVTYDGDHEEANLNMCSAYTVRIHITFVCCVSCFICRVYADITDYIWVFTHSCSMCLQTHCEV